MFIPFFENLRAAKIPVSLREYLSFLEATKTGMVLYDIEGFYFLARTSMVKDERNLDKFDQVFSSTFKGLENISVEDVLEAVDLPADWLTKMAEKHLSKEEKTIHPCQFPIELAERLILSMSKKNDLIVDPYAGVGTTLIAALKNKRRAAGSEILKKYINIAKKRINLLKKGKLPYRKINTPVQMVKGNSKLYRRT